MEEPTLGEIGRTLAKIESRVTRIPGLDFLVIAVGMAVVGVALIALPPGFSTPTTQRAIELAPLQWWGWVTLGSALLYLAFPRRKGSAAPLTAVSLAWGGVILWSSLAGGFRAAGVPWLIIAVLLALGQLRGDI